MVRLGSKAEVLASQGDVSFGSHSGHCSTRSARGKDPSSTEPQIRRLQGMLVEPIRLFCPTGKSLRVLPVCLSSPLSQKYFCFGLTQISCISKPSRLDKRGGSRVVTNAGRDAVDARASGAQWQSQGEMNLVSDLRRARRSALERTAKPCGPGTRCWC